MSMSASSYSIALTGLAIAILFGASGCMTGPDYARPDMVMPEQWSSPRSGDEVDAPAQLATWWGRFDDSALNDLIDQSIGNNFDLRIAEARVREARAARGVVRAAFWPTLEASGSFTESQVIEPEQPNAGSPVSFGLTSTPNGISRSITTRRGDLATTTSVTGDGTTTSYNYTPGSTPEEFDRTAGLFQAGFDARWEIDLFGGTRRASEAASADIDAAVERKRDVLVSLVAEVALNYIDLRMSQQRLAIANKNVAAQEKTVELTQARYDAGLNSELDAVRAKALLASTQSQIPTIKTRIDAAIHRLGVLAGKDPGAMKDALKVEAAMPALPGDVPVGLPSDLLRQRPDIRAAERQLAAANARIGEARADLFPKFYLTGSIGGQSASLGDVWTSPHRLWSIGPSIQWPLFQGGRIRANIEVQDARHEQALLLYERSIMLALEDVENGLVAYAQEQDRQESLRTAVNANESAVALANERYVRGLEGFLSVLQAQQQLYLSEDALVQSESQVLTNLVSLYKALGGGWSETDLPAGDAKPVAGSVLETR